MEWSQVVDAGTGVAYRRVGDGAPVVVLLHGWPETGEAWSEVAAVVADRCTVVVPDLPGYGGSAFAGGDGGKRVVAQVLARLVQRLGVDRVVVVGHDRGARVAHRWALDRPDQVSAVAVLDVVPMGAMLDRLDAESAARAWHWFFHASPEAEAIIARDVRGYVARALEGPHRAGVIDAERMQAYLDAYSRPGGIDGFLADYRAALGADLDLERAEMRAGVRVSVPVLALSGSRGPLSGADVAKIWARYATTVQAHTLDAGHYLPEERPFEVANLLLSLASQVAPQVRT